MANHSSQRMTFTLWTVCVIAAIGFAFDIYELLMLPLIVRDALRELGGIAPGTPEFTKWFGLLFYVPAVCGGIFGLLGGYLTDRLGRRRVLTWSILLYAFSAFAAGFSTNLSMLLFFRTTTFIGVCVEFVAATAWLAELFDDPEQREKVLGYTQAFSSIGGIAGGGRQRVDRRHARWPTVACRRFGSHRRRSPAIQRAVALHADERPDPRDPADHHPAVPARVAQVGGEEGRRHAAAAEHPRAVLAGAAADDDRHDDHVRLQLRRGVRRHPADAADRAGHRHGAGEGRRGDRGHAAAASQARGRPACARSRRPTTRSRRKSAGSFGRFALAMLVVQIASRRNLLRVFLVPGLIVAAAGLLAVFARARDRCSSSCDMSWLPGFHDVSITLLGIGDFPRRVLHRRPVQLLGQLSAAGLSGAPARHGRELCREHRRADVRDAVRVRDAADRQRALHAAARRRPGRADRPPRSRRGWRSSLFLVNLILSFHLPEQTVARTSARVAAVAAVARWSPRSPTGSPLIAADLGDLGLLASYDRTPHRLRLTR